MKVIYLKNRVIYISLLILIFLIILSLFLYDIFSEEVSKIEITHLEEKEVTPELILPSEEEKRKEMLLQKYQEKKLIALTFDDGPGKYTSQLIDELTKRNVSVTFFLLGENIEKFKDTVRFEVDTGNEIGIHSYEHRLFTKLTAQEIHEQIDKTKYLILEITDVPITLIRVPYGSINENVRKILDYQELTNILWTVDSKDWKFRDADKTFTYILKNLKGNDIILMHDIYPTSITCALKLIDYLQAESYVFVTVSEFLEIKQLAQTLS